MSSNINVNTAPSDMGSRNDQARTAGEIIYRSLSLSSSAEHGRRRHIPWDHQACCGIMSPVRRTFCLLAAFDLILSFILWTIYTQILPKSSTWDQFIHEVVHYSFKHSMFDTVMCSAWRCVPLLLGYALFRIRYPYVVAVTTFGTCVFVLCKVFIFKFEADHNNFMCYALLVVSFIISWIEVWFLDFKVLPKEGRAREQESMGIFNARPTGRANERTPLMGNNRSRGAESHDQYYSPKESYTPTPTGGSDDEGTPSGFRSPRARPLSLSEEIDYLDKAREIWDKAWEILQAEEGWKKETGSSLEAGLVYSKHFKQVGKLFKLEVYIDATPQEVFEEMVIGCDRQPEWNPTLLEAKTIQAVNENTDIYYNVAAEAAGGLVSSRDFVSLRHWKTRDDTILSAGCHVMHPDAPPSKKHVRGENRPGGWSFKAVPGEPQKCLFSWVINTDLKGWIPQYAVDQALSGTLLDFTKHLKKRMEYVQNT